MWSRDGNIYFVSDREGGGLANIWRVPEAGGKAERVTTFATGEVRWPAISADGKVIVFEHEFGVWKLDLASRRSTPIKIDIAAETQENVVDIRDFNSQVDDYDLAPSGRRIAFSIHGEIFSAPTEEGDLRQITSSAARDRDPQYSPDGKWIAFTSDLSGREEIYVAATDGSSEPRKITDIDTLKLSYRWSPDGKEIAFTSSDLRLRKHNLETKQTSELIASRYGNVGAPVWSPDGKWIAFTRSDETRTNDVYLIPSAGGEERKVTFDSANDSNPRFTPDGKKLYFVRSDGGGGGGGGGGQQPSAQLFSVALERQERDPDDPEERADTGDTSDAGAADGAARRAAPVRNQPPREITIKRRTRQVTRMPFAVSNYAIAPDSRTIVFLTSEPATLRTVPVVYSIQEDGRRLTRITAGAAPEGGEEGGPVGFFGSGGLRDFNFSRDGRTLFFLEARSVYSLPLAGGGGAPGAAAGIQALHRRRRDVGAVGSQPLISDLNSNLMRRRDDIASLTSMKAVPLTRTG